MPDVQVGRETYIMISDGGPALYPANTLYPADDLYPREATRIGNIVEGTMHLDELLCDGSLKFGQMCATRFEVTVYDTEDVGGKYLSVYQEDDGVFHQVFTGVVDSAKLDRLGTDRQVVAYDYAYAKSRINVASWWDNFWSTRESATLKQLRDSLLNYARIEYEDVELINDNITVTKTVNISSMPFNEMIRMICELSCCFPHFDRSGILRFYMLETDSTPASLESLYEGENSSFEDYITQNYTGIQFYGNSSDLQYTEGTNVNPYTIQENILLYNRTNEDLHTIGANMLGYISEITYRPSNVKMILSDWQYMLGDKVSTEKGSFYVLHNAFEGMQLIEQTIEQVGDETQDEVGVETNISDLFSNEAMDEMGEDIDDINDEIDDINETVGNLEIHLNRTDEGIEAEVRRAEGEEARIELKVDEFRSEIAGSQKEWDTTGYNVTEFGYDSPTTEGYEPSEYTGEYYLNQTNGYLYYSNGSAWNLIKYCQTIQASLQSSITQTANSINLEVSKKVDINGEGSNTVVSQINISPETITLSAGRLIINSGNFQLDSAGYAKATGFEAIDYLKLTDTHYGNPSAYILQDNNYIYFSTSNNWASGFPNIDIAAGDIYAIQSSNAHGDIIADGYVKSGGYNCITTNTISSYIPTVPSSTVDISATYSGRGIQFSNHMSGTYRGSSIQYVDDKTSTSDIRLKQNVRDMDDIESQYMQLRPVSFQFNPLVMEDEDKFQNRFGLIAQDVISVENDLVVYHSTPPGSPYEDLCGNIQLGINYNDLHAWHIQMIQKQHNKIEELENRIKILEEER